ncbi:WD40 repeat-like protein [Coniophora puteana RWD-64-598 SS2]|uniref:Probable cytosolic iron-sulfur protein assembly protein 1 n=1 Tax=Coniophora puteana (strain RWD-64-598) TaxID=741705 RepID=A0A5M3MCM9_CONPW|nr:WD40 repeat-like protein [Coniophora puteana RWD-64-598 SS2]EIW77012.1 WD40 repeat-like protein [Coniophora puteana RWD-64-598 SS2]
MSSDLPYTIRCIATLEGHHDRAWQVAWNPAKPLLASCSADKSVRMYAYSTKPSVSAGSDDPSAVGAGRADAIALTHVSTIPTGHTKTVRSIAWAPSGRTLATGSFDANIGVWEQEEGDGDGEDGENGGGGGTREWECATLLEGHETECKGVAYSAGGELLATCSRDKTVWIWEVHPDSDFECMGVLMEHTQDVKCVAWHPSEQILASASYDDTIKLYADDPDEDWVCVQTLAGHQSTVWALAWSPCGTYLASASDDLTIKVWKRAGEHRWEGNLEIKGAHTRSIYSISWGKGKGDGGLGWLTSTGSDGKINVWDIQEPPEGSKELEHKLIASLSSSHDINDVNSVAWCARAGYEDMFATAGDDGLVKAWVVVPA